MDDKNIEIHNDEINVEKILGQIRENIRTRQTAGKLSTVHDNLISPVPCIESNSGVNKLTNRDLIYINSNWEIHNNGYFISSHHPYFGKILVKGRQIVHAEVRRYIDPVISRQTGFNASVVRIINHIMQKCAELEQRYAYLERNYEGQKQKLGELEDSSYKEQRILDQKISQCIEMVDTTIERKIDERIDVYLSRMDEGIDERAWLVHVLENHIHKGIRKQHTESMIPSKELNYYLFEERFRGVRDSIKQQQLAFIPFFENCTYVLDIGCGRGEFLEILLEQNIGGIGIDIDPDMVQFCRSRNLNVEQADAIAYLEKVTDNSLEGIFIDQVVEHLEPDYLVRMLAACFQKLKYGGVIVVETVNPLSLASFFNFYLDMSHHKPIHPLTLNFLLESVGFRNNEIKYYSPIPDEVKLQKIKSDEKISDTEQKFLDNYNCNIELLNNLLWGPRDYAIIGKK